MAITQRIQRLDEELDTVASDIDLTRINPSNAQTIKDSYNGEEKQFLYPKAPEYALVQERLQKMTFPATPEGELLRKKRDYLFLMTELIRSAGTRRFTSVSKKLYPLPGKKLLRAAEEILSAPEAKRAPKVEMEDALHDLEDAITQLGIPWHVQRIDMIASAAVVPSKRMVFLKEKTKFSKRYIERLRIHEIGTHAVRAENGRLQPLKIFLHGTAGYLPTEEGLAVYNEERFGLLDHTVMRTYAGRVLAVHLAQRHGFVEVAEELKKYFPEKKALTIALRAKRGVAHSGDKGGYTKDTAYLQGYLALKEYERKGGDFSPLYYGKIALDDLPLIEKFTWLKKPKYLPEMIRP